jgi:broad specificity phosphatase PhoE
VSWFLTILWFQVLEDSSQALLTRAASLERNIAIFSHGHFGRVLGARWIGLPVRQAQHLLLSAASLSVLGYEHNRPKGSVIALWERHLKPHFDLMTKARSSP